MTGDAEKERASVAELPAGEEKDAVVVRLREKEAREVVAGEAVVLAADVEQPQRQGAAEGGSQPSQSRTLSHWSQTAHQNSQERVLRLPEPNLSQ